MKSDGARRTRAAGGASRRVVGALGLFLMAGVLSSGSCRVSFWHSHRCHCDECHCDDCDCDGDVDLHIDLAPASGGAEPVELLELRRGADGRLVDVRRGPALLVRPGAPR